MTALTELANKIQSSRLPELVPVLDSVLDILIERLLAISAGQAESDPDTVQNLRLGLAFLFGLRNRLTT